MEFLQITLIGLAGLYIWRSPDKQHRAEMLLLAATVIMIAMWFIATKSMLLPAGNY